MYITVLIVFFPMEWKFLLYCCILTNFLLFFLYIKIMVTTYLYCLRLFKKIKIKNLNLFSSQFCFYSMVRLLFAGWKLLIKLCIVQNIQCILVLRYALKYALLTSSEGVFNLYVSLVEVKFCDSFF